MNAQTIKRIKILLADDGSQHAQAAIQMLQELPLPEKSKVHVLRAFPPGLTYAVGEMERSLEQAKEKLLADGIAAETELLLGYPAEKIVETAEALKPNLIMLGAKGLRATLGILLGGVAQQVVEYACCPVMIIRAPYRPLKRILLVTDGSSHSQHAARYLAKFPLPEEVKVHIVHVIPPPLMVVMSGSYVGGMHDFPLPIHTLEDDAEELERLEKEGETILMRTHNLLQKNGLDATSVLLRGDAATEIIDYIKNNEIDLTVAGSRGLSSFQGWLLGSVSRKLVHYSNCSVLIVKRPPK